jgi:hypothetical protein
MSGLPWGKFFWKDWLTDPALSVCSLAAQGLWMRMLCIMSMSEPPGHLILPPTRRAMSEAKHVAGMCHADARQVRPLLDELETRKVFSRDNAGTIVSRRMIREAELSTKGRSNATKRWNKPNGHPNGHPNGDPNGDGYGPDTLTPMADPMLRTDTDKDSPPKRPRKSRRSTHAAPDFRSGFGSSADADMQETLDHATATDPRPHRATVVPIARHLERR